MALSRRSILKAAIRMSVSQSTSCVDHVICVVRITHVSSRESRMDEDSRDSTVYHVMWKCYRETGSLKELALRVCHESTRRFSLFNTSPKYLEPDA
ncbi:hypothetical protein F2P79_025013 [Pimephales promelas]|nr:hypothetical protein F2P79_025013 [Pimephales promelas]